jgi:hypothetical protein
MLVMLTNDNVNEFQMPITGYEEGTKLCNIFDPVNDCQNVLNGSISVSMSEGISKVFLPTTSEYFTNSAKFLFTQ